MLGPQGVGALYLRRDLTKSWIPAMTGGGAINLVADNMANIAGLPNRWTPGTQNIAGLIGWSAAIQYLRDNETQIRAHDQTLLSSLRDLVSDLGDQMQILG